MTLDQLIAAAEALRGTHGGQAPVVVEITRAATSGAAMPLVRSVRGEMLAQLQPRLYARAESQRFALPAVVIKA